MGAPTKEEPKTNEEKTTVNEKKPMTPAEKEAFKKKVKERFAGKKGTFVPNTTPEGEEDFMSQAKRIANEKDNKTKQEIGIA